ncbi:M23/M56 family metallopeptidase [Thalassotalea sp. ND16A]|uniref:M23/M56 family metallopeptidase n=1 Tax=Thalassotalea sp. ND16A TaxID=1535422 RepID=UPI00051DAADC|nr:M23/M56 family metallopeptidase [Thalassotalea sp. ND16A]KGJ90507.1 hypothetical protein ND16A_1903 [Thalassotalea sp. ND16A]
MDYQFLFNTISLQLLVFTICSGLVVLFSTLAIRLNPLLGEWSSYWFFAYLLCFLSLFPIALISFDSDHLYVLKDLITLNQQHLVIHASTENYIPNDNFEASVFIQLILALIVISTLRALSIFTLRSYRVIALIKDAEQVSYIQGMSDSQRQELESRRIKVMISADAPPLAYGFFSKYILLPHTIEGMTPEHKQMLIEHELQHHRKHDTKKVILLRFLTGLFWFNPFIHHLEKRFMLSMETNCDKEVVKSLAVDSAEYAKSLIRCLRICQHSNSSRLTAYFSSPNSLQEELEMRVRKVMVKIQQVNCFTHLQVFAFFLVNMSLAILIKSGFFILDFSAADEGQMPISAGYISFDYSESKHDPHFGIDIQAPSGVEVKASFTGRVIIADNSSLDKGFGVTVLIEHKDNTTSLYANLNQLVVDVGQIVRAGDVIGTLGDTLGQDTSNNVTPHLHFEISISGKHVNPNQYLHGYGH